MGRLLRALVRGLRFALRGKAGRERFRRVIQTLDVMHIFDVCACIRAPGSNVIRPVLALRHQVVKILLEPLVGALRHELDIVFPPPGWSPADASLPASSSLPVSIALSAAATGGSTLPVLRPV